MKSEQIHSNRPNPSVYFPQRCSHVAHGFNHRGELRTALIAGGRLVVFKEAFRVGESSPLQQYFSLDKRGPPLPTPNPGDSSIPDEAESLLVRGVSVCPFTEDVVRVVVATNHGVLIFEMRDEADRGCSVAPPGSGGQISDAHEPKSVRSHGQWIATMHGEHAHLPSDNHGKSVPNHIVPVLASSSAPWGQPLHGCLLLLDGVSSYSALAGTPLHRSLHSVSEHPSFILSTNGSPLTKHSPSIPAASADAASAHHRMCVPAGVRRVEFLSENALLLLSRDEVALVILDTAPSTNPLVRVGRLAWQSKGTYRLVATSPVNRHVALALESSTVIVFPCQFSDQLLPAPGPLRPSQHDPALNLRSVSVLASPLYTPTAPLVAELPVFSASGRDGREDEFATVGEGVALSHRGIVASLGSYSVVRLAWHRLTSYTLLCVHCVDPSSGENFLVLYSLQRIRSIRHFTNVFQSSVDSEEEFSLVAKQADSVNRSTPPLGSPSTALLQLVPVGRIAMNPPAGPSAGPPVRSSVGPNFASQGAPFTLLVPRFDRFESSTHNLCSYLQLLHVEADGSVGSSSYALGGHTARLMEKQARTVQCARLLAPLLRLYGDLTHVEVLPAWRSSLSLPAASEDDTITQQFCCRLRCVLHFDCSASRGVVAVVLIDLGAETIRVEHFLAVGSAPVLALKPVRRSPGSPGSIQLIAGVMGKLGHSANSASSFPKCSGDLREWCHGVLILSQRMTASGHVEVMASGVCPLEPHLSEDLTECAGASDGHIAATPNLADHEASDMDVERYLEAVAPEKIRFLPALLKACGNDAGKLLRQLVAKYGTDHDHLVASPPCSNTSAEYEYPGTPIGVSIDDTAMQEDGVQLIVSVTSPSGMSASRLHYSMTLPSSNLALLFATGSRLLPVPGVLLPVAGYTVAGEVLGNETTIQTNTVPTTSRLKPCCHIHRCDGHAGWIVEVQSPTLALPWVVTISSEAEDGTAAASVMDFRGEEEADSAVGCMGEVVVQVVRAEVALLCSNDTILAVVVRVVRRKGEDTDGYLQLRLYGCSAVQHVSSDAEVSSTQLEAVVPGISSFSLSSHGEVIVVIQGCRTERLLRCFPNTNADTTGAPSRFRYCQDSAWDGSASAAGDGLCGIAAMEPMHSMRPSAWRASAKFLGGQESSMVREVQWIVSTMESDALWRREGGFALIGEEDTARQQPLATMEGLGSSDGVPHYHPDVLMQLLGMARWSLLSALLLRLRDAVCAEASSAEARETMCYSAAASVSGEAPAADSMVRSSSSVTPAELAHLLCSRSGGMDGGGARLTGEYMGRRRKLAPSGMELHSHTSFDDGSKRLSEVFSTENQAMLADLMHSLPQVELAGLSSTDMLELLCIMEALHAASGFSCSVDEAASRFFLFHKLNTLRRRLNLPNYLTSHRTDEQEKKGGGRVDPASIFFFAEGHTAARSIHTASFLWAAMSDSQSSIVEELFSVPGGASLVSAIPLSASSTINLSDLELSGAAFWLRSTPQLRKLTELIARNEYQATKDVTRCALMYCLAQKVGTLAALCKAQNQTKLSAFFSRPFGEEKHRTAAEANAYAAVGKGMPLYGAAFFVLAGNHRCAAQIILQRSHNPSLALLVLRCGAPNLSTLMEDLLWYRQQRDSEAATCGVMDMWESTCVDWLNSQPEEMICAMQRISAHPTGHPEVLCALRYAREKVATITGRRARRFLSPTQELMCLMRLGRYCMAREMQLNGLLNFRDALEVLREVVESQAEGHDTDVGTLHGATRSRAPATKMEADFTTGTLHFKMDSDDDEYPAVQPPAPSPMADDEATKAADTVMPTSLTELQHVLRIVRAELRYAFRKLNAQGLLTEDELAVLEWQDGAAEGSKETEVARSPTAMEEDAVMFYHVAALVSVCSNAPMLEVEGRMAGLISHALPRPNELEVRPNTPQREHENEGSAPLCAILVLLLHWALSVVAWRTQDVVLAMALRLLNRSEVINGREVQKCDGADSSSVHPVTALFFFLSRNMESLHVSFMVEALRNEMPKETPLVSEDPLGHSPHRSVWEQMAAERTSQADISSLFGAPAADMEEDGRDGRCLEASTEELLAGSCATVHCAIALPILQQLRRYTTEVVSALGPVAAKVSGEAPDSRRWWWPYAHALLANYGLVLIAGSLGGLAEGVLHSCRFRGKPLSRRSPGSSRHSPSRCADYSRLVGDPSGVMLDADHALNLLAELLREKVMCVAHRLGREASFPMSKEDSRRCSLLPLTELIFRQVEVLLPSALSASPTGRSLHTVPPLHPLDALHTRLRELAKHHWAMHRLLHLLEATPDAHDARVFGNWLVVASTAAGEGGGSHVRHERNPSQSFGGSVSSSSPFSNSTPGNQKNLPAFYRAVLHFLESLCLRRYLHPDAQRAWLLHLSFESSTSTGRGKVASLTTDRLLLHQCTHAVTGVDYDHASGDALAWTSDEGTRVGSSFREILAGDNASAMQRLAIERELASTALTQGRCSDSQSASQASSSKRSVSSIVANSMPSSHPHLPLYLATNREEGLLLYGYQSTTCLGRFALPSTARGSHPSTKAAFSPDGYMVAVGLEDGSVVGWRFCVGTDNMPTFCYADLFPSSGIRAVLFCEHRSSAIAVVGMAVEPRVAVARHVGGWAKESGSSPSSSITTHRKTKLQKQRVGEVLVVDCVVSPGEVVARCALPFVPDFAVMVPSLDAVLAVSAEGFMALYEVGYGRLSLINMTDVNEAWGNRRTASMQLSSSALTVSPVRRHAPTLPETDDQHRRLQTVTAMAVSAYDPLVAIGTSGGYAFVFTVDAIAGAARQYASWQHAQGMDPYVFYADGSVTGERAGAATSSSYAPESQSVLWSATLIQVAPLLTSQCTVEDLAFTPSALLAGLRDGKVVAASLVPQALEQSVASLH